MLINLRKLIIINNRYNKIIISKEKIMNLFNIYKDNINNDNIRIINKEHKINPVIRKNAEIKINFTLTLNFAIFYVLFIIYIRSCLFNNITKNIIKILNSF